MILATCAGLSAQDTAPADENDIQYYPPDANLPYLRQKVRLIDRINFAGNNMVSIGTAFGWFGYGPDILLRLEYVRQFSNKHFSIGVSLTEPIMSLGEDPVWQMNDDRFVSHTILSGMIYYRVFLSKHIALSLGAGVGAGYFISSKEDRARGINNSVVPYLNLSVGWVFMIAERHEIKIPLPAVVGPIHGGLSLIKGGGMHFIELALSFSYGYRF